MSARNIYTKERGTGNMTNKKEIFLSLLCAGMEIFWLYAWAAFCMIAAKGFFPPAGALIIFILAAVTTRFSTGRGWRIIFIIAVHGFASAAALSLIIYLSYFSSYPLFNKDWLVEFFRIARSPLDWLNLILLVLWSVLFWISGRAFSKRTNTYFAVCGRFDLGLAAFFSLFILKLILAAKGGIRIDDISFTLIFPFFLFSLLAIGIVKTQNTSKKFLPGFRGIGIIMGISIVALLSALTIIVLTPALTWTAEAGYSVLKSGAGIIMPVVITILRFMFAPRSMRSEPAESSSKPDDFNWGAESGWWPLLLDKIFKWGIKIVSVICIVIISGVALYYLFKWLFSRTASIRREVDKSNIGAPWFVRLWAVLVSIFKIILMKLRGYNKAVEFYHMLLIWGRRSGIQGLMHETPLEYGSKLKYQFPRLVSDIDLIIAAFNSEVYGGMELSIESIADTRSAWRKVRSPRNWPARLKSLLFMDRNSLLKFIGN
jgi:hypothetical protein